MAVRGAGDDGVTQVNRGSDGFERAVSNSLLVFSSAPTGPLARINVLPSNATAFVGSAIQYTVKGQDAAFNRVTIDPPSVGWSIASSSLGSISPTGRFVSSGTGSSVVTSTVGSLTGSTNLSILDSLQALEISPSPAIVSPGGSLRFSLTGKSASGATVIVDNAAAAWQATGPIGTISNDGVLTASPMGSGTVRATADGASVTVNVEVGRPPAILEDFEDIADMVATAARATATLTSSMRPNPVRHGTRSGKLGWNFTGQMGGSSAAYAAHSALLPIADRPLRIGVWVYGDGSRHWIRGNYRDAANAQKTIDFTAAPTPAPVVSGDCRNRSKGIDWTGWKYIEAAIPSDAALPIKWERIYVIETNDLCDDSSAVFLDDLRAVYSDTAEDLVGPEVSNVFPAQGLVVATSRPEIGGTVKDPAGGGGVAPASVRLTIDGAQVAVVYDPVTGIARYTPATPLSDGPHQVRLEAEDQASNPALPFGQWSFIINTGPPRDRTVRR